MYKMILYSESISFAFGEPPDFGVKKFASASGAETSETARASASAVRRSRRRRGR